MFKRNHLLFSKFIYTGFVILLYFIGRSLPLYGVDANAYSNTNVDLQNLLLQTVTGDRNQISLFALGISPYMVATMIVQILASMLGEKRRSKISSRFLNRLTVSLMLIIGGIQALLLLPKLQMKAHMEINAAVGFVIFMEMIVGICIILWLSECNKKYGIGGQSTLILVNIGDGIVSTLTQAGKQEVLQPLLFSLVVVVIIIFMEMAEFRIPVQRISVQTIYEDKNYIAFKLNPVGVMPIMFTSACFMLVQALTGFVSKEGAEELQMDNPLGLTVYLIIVFVLTIFFSLVFVNPDDMAERLLKNGDCLARLHSGKETSAYFTKVLLALGILSSFVLSLCILIPFLWQQGESQNDLMMLPTSFMMLAGILCNIYEETRAVKSLGFYDSYEV